MSLRVLQASVIPRRIHNRRYATHGSPQYNEPSGWLFGEKVGNIGSLPLRRHY